MRVVFCAIMVWLAGAAAAFAAPPIEAYGQLPGLGDFALSPDGSRYAAIVGAADSSEIQVRELATGKLLVATPAGKYKLRAIQWAGNDNLVLTLSQTAQLQSTDYAFTGRGEYFQLLSYDFARARWLRLLNEIPLTGNVVRGVPSVVDIDGKPQLVAVGISIPSTTSLSTVFRIDPANGRAVVMERGAPETQDWAIDGTGKIVARADYDRKSGLWKVMAPRGAGWGEIYRETAAIDVPELRSIGRSPGSVQMVTHKSGDWQVHELALADGALSAPEPDAYATITSATTRAPIGRVRRGMTNIDYEFFEASDAALWRSIGRAFPGALVEFEGWTPDRAKVAVNVFGGAFGNGLYIVDRRAKTAGLLSQRYPGIEPADIAPVQAITYKAADGTEISAYLTLPPGREAKRLPLVALPHGGPASRDDPGFNWWAQALASRGYAVLQPQFRGSAGFGETHLQAGYGQWGRKMQTDVSDGVRHLAGLGTIDPARVCIAGGSYGGYAAMAGVTVEQGVYRCASAIAGVSDLRKMLQRETRDAGNAANPAVRYWQRFMGAKDNYDTGIDAYSPARLAARVTAPLQLIHGKDDLVVPIEQSNLMASAMKDAGKPVEMIVLPSEDHWLSRPATRIAMLKALVEFLEKHNPPGPPEGAAPARAARD